ncbi:unnamed protein product [Caenorhabditis nigoni]
MSFVIGSMIKNRYHVTARLGRGSFGTVYKITDIKEEKAKAMKTIGGFDPDMNEVRTLTTLASIPGVQRMYSHFIHKGTLCLILEMYSIDLGTLADRQEFTQHLVLKVGYQLVEIFKAIHNLGFLHRDLKSENVMVKAVGNNARLKVIDFGMAKCFMTPDGNLVPVPQKDFNFAACEYSSLSLSMGNRATEADDIVMILYLMMSLCRLNPFEGGRTYVQKIALKTYFHTNPTIALANHRYLIPVARLILSQISNNIVDHDVIMNSVQNSAGNTDLKTPFQLRFARRNKVTFILE